MNKPISEFKKIIMRLLLDVSWDEVLHRVLELRNERLSKIISYENRMKQLNDEIEEINEIEIWLRKESDCPNRTNSESIAPI